MNPPDVGGARAFNELYADTDPDPDPAGASSSGSTGPSGSAAPYKRSAPEDFSAGAFISKMPKRAEEEQSAGKGLYSFHTKCHRLFSFN